MVLTALGQFGTLQHRRGSIPLPAIACPGFKRVLLNMPQHIMHYYFNDRYNYATKTTEYLERLL